MNKIQSALPGPVKLLVIVVALLFPAVSFAQYTVVPRQSFARGHLWIGDGAAAVLSANKSAGDRLRVGGEIHLGEDYRYIIGWTFYDRIYSGEKSNSAGDISRRATDFNFGYFVVPNRLWAMYTIALTDESGSEVIGTVSPVGHQASIGYRFFQSGAFNMAIEAAYLYIPSYVADTYDFNTKISSSVKFPVANVWSLNLRFGFDFGW